MTSEHRLNRIRRLIYQSSYTGMRETDQILGPFARDCLDKMTDQDLDAYEDLLDFGDPTIWGWVSGNDPVPSNITNPVLVQLMDWVEQHKS